MRSTSRHSASLARISRRNRLMAKASVLVDSPFNFRDLSDDLGGDQSPLIRKGAAEIRCL